MRDLLWGFFFGLMAALLMIFGPGYLHEGALAVMVLVSFLTCAWFYLKAAIARDRR